MKQVKKSGVRPGDATPQVGTLSHEDKSETSLSRVAQVRRFEAGVLMGMLFDEARRRNQELAEMAHALSVTPGYVHQLATRLRSTAHISHDFATACASYLNVPAIVVKVLAGTIVLSDFLLPESSEEEVLHREFAIVQAHPQFLADTAGNETWLGLDMKALLVMMYSDAAIADLLHLKELPRTLRWLQQVAQIHADNGNDGGVQEIV